MREPRGFTLIELMIVVVIIGILASISIPNFFMMVGRAREGATKSNMHTLQIAAEDYAVTYNSFYSTTIDATHVADLLPGSFKNPFDGSTGAGGAWEDRASMSANPSSKPGISSYADSANNTYNIKGYGKTAQIILVLSSGQ